MHNTEFMEIYRSVVDIIKESNKICDNKTNSLDTRQRAIGFSLCLGHMVALLDMNNPTILDRLANNLKFMKVEIQKEEENALVRSVSKSKLQKGGKAIH